MDFDLDKVRSLVEAHLDKEAPFLAALVKEEVAHLFYENVREAIVSLKQGKEAEIQHAIRDANLKDLEYQLEVAAVARVVENVEKRLDSKTWDTQSLTVLQDKVRRSFEEKFDAALQSGLRGLVQKEIDDRREELSERIKDGLEKALSQPLGELLRREIGLVYNHLQEIEERERVLRAAVDNWAGWRSQVDSHISQLESRR